MKTNGIFMGMHGLQSLTRKWLGFSTRKESSLVNNGEKNTIYDKPVEKTNDYGIIYDTVEIFDVSGSMSSADCEPSRLGAAKQAGLVYVQKRAMIFPQDRIAIVEFNSSGYVVLPFTNITMSETAKISFDKLIASGSTNLKAGLSTAWEIAKKCTDENTDQRRRLRFLLLTDGDGGEPIKLANEIKSYGVLIEAIGFAGSPSEVNEVVLKQIATTDADGFTHYWFFKDSQSLVEHYENLASGIIFRGNR